MKTHTKYSEENCVNDTLGLFKRSEKNSSTISVDDLPKCSVSLEKLELNESNTNRTSDQKHESSVESLSLMPQPEAMDPEAAVIDMDMHTIETVASINEAATIPNQNDNGYRHMPDIESDQLFADEQQNQYYFQMEPNFKTNPFDAYNLSEDQLISTVDIQPELPLVKEEKMDTAPPIFKMDDVVYDVLDSDEEEALYSRDSGRGTNDLINDLDSGHVPTMGVLMMIKK